MPRRSSRICLHILDGPLRWIASLALKSQLSSWQDFLKIFIKNGSNQYYSLITSTDSLFHHFFSTFAAVSFFDFSPDRLRSLSGVSIAFHLSTLALWRVSVKATPTQRQKRKSGGRQEQVGSHFLHLCVPKDLTAGDGKAAQMSVEEALAREEGEGGKIIH